MIDIPRHHADDREGLPGKGDETANDVGSGAEPAVPQAMGQHEYVLGAGPIIVSTQGPAIEWLGLQHLKEIAADACGTHHE